MQCMRNSSYVVARLLTIGEKLDDGTSSRRNSVWSGRKEVHVGACYHAPHLRVGMTSVIQLITIGDKRPGEIHI